MINLHLTFLKVGYSSKTMILKMTAVLFDQIVIPPVRKPWKKGDGEGDFCFRTLTFQCPLVFFRG